ncbi:hypothetical protein [Escherichia coli]|uniref:hypothetical protein n=1 Tax=Escherichia coli TaxID=562 RepID=UPI003F899843
MINTYLLDDDIRYKILILYILKNINGDVRRNIYDILVKIDLEEFMNQEFTELTLENLRDLNELDYYLELELYSDQ